MATLAQVKNTVDTWLAPKWTAIQNAQATYLANKGHYFQGLITHSASLPADGADATPDNTASAHPTDQADKWAAFIALPAAFPCALIVDVYDGPQGTGYVAKVIVSVAGVLYTRTVQVGLETWRVVPWQQFTSPSRP